jgi:bifunctional non-homologous end joining protein LigD
VRAYTRNGFDWSDRYPGLVRSAARLNCRAAVLDGEVIVQDDRGRSDFEALKSAIRWEPQRLLFYGFDLLHYEGTDLRECPVVERRAKLKELFGNDRASPLQFSEEFSGDGAALFIACAEHGLEGIVSKEVASHYRSGRSKTWLKTKCFTEGNFVVIGMDRDRKTGAILALLARRPSLGSLPKQESAYRSDLQRSIRPALPFLDSGRERLNGLSLKLRSEFDISPGPKHFATPS